MNSGEGEAQKIAATICDLILLCVLSHQIMVYVRRYREDRLILKTWIWTNSALEIASTCLLLASLYLDIKLQFIWIIIGSIIALLSQSFLGFQAYLAAGNLRFHILLAVWSFTLLTFISGLVCAVEIQRNNFSLITDNIDDIEDTATTSNITHNRNIDYISTTLFLTMSAGLDVVLATGFFCLFYKGRQDFDPIAYRVMRTLTITMTVLAYVSMFDLIAFSTNSSLNCAFLYTHTILNKLYFLGVLWPMNNRTQGTSIDGVSRKEKGHANRGNKNSIDVDTSRISESGYVYGDVIPIMPISRAIVTRPVSAHLPGSKSNSISTSNSSRLSQINLEATHDGYWASLDDD